MLTTWEIIKRLVLSAVLGGLIGAEREVSNRPAGLRTHILVTLGSTLIMLISMDAFYYGGNVPLGDPARIAAQVVSGIGFLGAGTIMRTGNNIVGLTTAASLWVSAGIGLAIGSGYYVGAIVTSGIVLLTLMSLGVLEKRAIRKKYRIIEVAGVNRPGLIGNIGTLFGKHNISIRNIDILDEGLDENEGGIMKVAFLVKLPTSLDLNDFYKEIYNITGIISVDIEGVENLYKGSIDSSLFTIDDK